MSMVSTVRHDRYEYILYTIQYSMNAVSLQWFDTCEIIKQAFSVLFVSAISENGRLKICTILWMIDEGDDDDNNNTNSGHASFGCANSDNVKSMFRFVPLGCQMIGMHRDIRHD